MPWWAWTLLAFAALLLLSVAAYLAIRSTVRGRRLLALSRRGKVRFVRTLLADPSLSRLLRLLLASSLLYLAFPIDVVPDFLPVVGHADDLFVLVLAAALLLFLTPRAALDRALAAGEEYDARHARRKRDHSARSP